MYEVYPSKDHPLIHSSTFYQRTNLSLVNKIKFITQIIVTCKILPRHLTNWYLNSTIKVNISHFNDEFLHLIFKPQTDSIYQSCGNAKLCCLDYIKSIFKHPDLLSVSLMLMLNAKTKLSKIHGLVHHEIHWFKLSHLRIVQFLLKSDPWFRLRSNRKMLQLIGKLLQSWHI